MIGVWPGRPVLLLVMAAMALAYLALVDVAKRLFYAVVDMSRPNAAGGGRRTSNRERQKHRSSDGPCPEGYRGLERSSRDIAWAAAASCGAAFSMTSWVMRGNGPDIDRAMRWGASGMATATQRTPTSCSPSSRA